MFAQGIVSKRVFDFLKHMKIDAVKDGEISPDFQEDKKLPVVIFSHGVRGHRNMCSGLCWELASQGFAVFSLEHNDGSSASHFDEKKLEQIEYSKEDMTDLALW